MLEHLTRRYGWIYRPLVITILTALLIGSIAFVPKAIDAINNRTFDSETQKSGVLEMHSFLLEMRIKELQEAARRKEVKIHLEDKNLHMSMEEKEQLIVIREAVKSMSRDIQEIKEAVKKN